MASLQRLSAEKQIAQESASRLKPVDKILSMGVASAPKKREDPRSSYTSERDTEQASGVTLPG